MTKKGLLLGSAAFVLAAAMGAGPSLAQDVDFGDDSSSFANNGRCDDPRFEGPGAAIFRSPLDMGRDATDCRTALEAGRVALTPTAQSALAAQAEIVDDGAEEDAETDPAEVGEGPDLPDEIAPAEEIDADGPEADAQDVEVVEPDDEPAEDVAAPQDLSEPAQENAAEPDAADIDFGDDSGRFARDGECDDPRFGGRLESHRYADATDCREAFDAGMATYLGTDAGRTVIDGIDFGTDDGRHAFDHECDDPRFTGPGMGVALSDHLRADASDCASAYREGTVTYLGEDATDTLIDGIDFGDDSGFHAFDDECDDPRFTGPGMGVALSDHLRADATDCLDAYLEGSVTYIGEDAAEAGDRGSFRINFGDDSGPRAFDGVCDDPRFQGRGAAPELYHSSWLADATDCRDAHEAGTVRYDP